LKTNIYLSHDQLLVMSLVREIESALDDFMRRTSPDTRGALISRKDGLPVASRVSINLNSKLASAMVAIAKNSLERLGKELELGMPTVVVSLYQKSTLLLSLITNELILAVIAEPETNLGLLMLEIERLQIRLRQIISD